MNQTTRESLLAKYQGLGKADLLAEKGRQEKEVKEQTAIWETTGLGGSIALTFFGSVLIVVIIGIPMLIFGIRGIVRKSKTRNRANIAIWKAKDAIEILDELLLKEERKAPIEQKEGESAE